jgi:glucose-1-phosphate cytidylyltransferase
MKVVLFCGGSGMRLRGYVDDVPKPMVQIGSRPILWHLMKYYAHFGHKDFILCLGHKGNVIKDYFLHYEESVSNDFVWSQGGKKIEFVNRDIDDWTITFVETGANANIGERFKMVEPYLDGEDMFLANYADGLSDLDLPVMVEEFSKTNAVGSLLLVQPTASFDIVELSAEGKVGQISP